MSWNTMQFGAVTKTSAAMVAIPMTATLLLTGCGGTASPVAPPATTAASSPIATSAPITTTSPTNQTTSVSPTTVPKTDPNIPAAARAHTIAGAEAFVRYYVERLNVAWTVPRAGILSPLCQASSISCAANEQTATRLVKEGHHYDGNPVSIKFIGVLDATKPSRYDVLANLVQEQRSEVDAAGKVIVNDKRKKLRVNFELLYIGRAWSVATIQGTK